ncbi:MAG: adenosine deaminase CECR1 [Paraglaciecola sp.]|jgi:adenosine deaminase CECR1
MTDEYFVAVHEFNLSWQELIGLAGNSLLQSFADTKIKIPLLAGYHQRIAAFERRFVKDGVTILATKPTEYGIFICQHYSLCPLTSRSQSQ